jgi:uncharacterized protein (DUF488 family)
VEIYTIGFTKKSARRFFEQLKAAGVRKLIDVRISNTSQLAGFTRRDDLAYFTESILGATYVHEPRLAPTLGLLRSYRKAEIDWTEFEARYLRLLADRKVELLFSQQFFSGPSALLCSEPTADHCHRRLVLEYLGRHWPGISPVHL